LTSRGVPPGLTNNNMLFQHNGIPFDEPLAKSSYLELVSLEQSSELRLIGAFSLPHLIIMALMARSILYRGMKRLD